MRISLEINSLYNFFLFFENLPFNNYVRRKNDRAHHSVIPKTYFFNFSIIFSFKSYARFLTLLPAVLETKRLETNRDA